MSSGQQHLFCINCQHIATNGSGTWETFRCMAPENEDGMNFVTGAKIYKIEFCRHARYREYRINNEGKEVKLICCGIEGNWYKEKQPILPASKEARQIYGTIKSPEDMGL